MVAVIAVANHMQDQDDINIMILIGLNCSLFFRVTSFHEYYNDINFIYIYIKSKIP